VRIPKFDSADFSVLLVEHNRFLASILRHILATGGIRQVLNSLDAISALEMLKTNPVNVALLDEDLPGITAIELATLIRTAHDSPNRRLPLILLSSRPTKRLVNQALKAGINYYVKKPLSAGVLLQRVKYAIENHDNKEKALARLGF
jgi:two-component system chemotaxis response regulator CheY